MAITRNPVTAYIRELDKDEPKVGKSKRATLKNITQNPVAPTTTVPVLPKSSRATITDITGPSFTAMPSGTTVFGSGKGASTTGEEKRKLAAGVESVKRRITTNLALTAKQKQELIADAERIGAGQRREVTISGPTPSFIQKLQNVAVSKVLSPFKSNYVSAINAGGDFSVKNQTKAWAGLVGDILNPINRVGQSATKELSDLQLSIKNPVLRGLAQTAGSFVATPLAQAGADIISMGNTKEELLKRSDIGGDKITPSLTDFVNQIRDPDFALKKTVIATRNIERNKYIGNVQNLLAEEITKPLNYVTGVGEVQYVGALGRTTLAAKFQTIEMIAKYPQLAGKANEIGRIGMWAIPREIRLAEGINTGLRLAGKPAQWTEPIADVLGKSFAVTRAQIGDVARAAINLPLTAKGIPALPNILTPASRAVVGLAGRKTLSGDYVLNNTDVIRGLAGWSATNAAKGETGFAYNLLKAEVAEIVQEARDAGVAGKLISLIEDPDLPRTLVEDALVKRYKAWQDGAYASVRDQYKRFGVDFGSEIPDFSFIDDYVHHRITKDAKNWIRSNKGFDISLGKKATFNTNNLSYEDIVTVGAPLKYRQLKAGEEFMGRILEKGGIDEINKIFKEVSGSDINFFETEIGNIADSYAYSLAKTKSREVFTRRLMAYGEDAAQLLLKNEIPNRQLAGELAKTHKSLLAVRNSLRLGGARQRQTLKTIVDRGVKYADDLVKENFKQRKLTEREIKATVTKLRQLEADLVRSKTMASTITVAERENFAAAHAVLLADIKELTRAIEIGDGGLAEVKQTLQQTYMAMFPNAKRIPDDLNILADRISAARGAPASREARAVQEELRKIETQLELVDTNSPEYAALVQQEGYYKDLQNGFRIMAEVRTAQTYAPDNGFLYTSVTDLGTPDAPFQLLHSEPAVFAGSSDVIGVHAIPDEKLVDSRTTAGVQEIFGSDNFVKSLDTQLQDAGLDAERVFIKTYYDLKRGVPLDPEIERGYPDLVNLIDDILKNSEREMPAGGDSDVVHAIYDDFVSALVGIAHMSGDPNANEVGRLIMDSALGDVALAADLEQQLDGLLLPAKLFDETAEDTAVVIIKPSDYTVTPSKSTTAPVQGMDSPVLRSVLESEYTTASEAAAGRFAHAASARKEVDVARNAIGDRIRELTARRQELAGQKTQRLATVAGARAKIADVAATPQTLILGGKKVVLNRAGITKALQQASKQEARLRTNLEKSIVEAVGDIRVGGKTNIKGAEKRLLQYQDRLTVLFEQARTLKLWNETTGNAMRNEISAIGQAMLNMPARGEAGGVAREWVRSVQRSVESTKFIKDKTTRDAYQRITELLHVGEIGLAQAEDAVVASKEMLRQVQTGEFGAILAPVEAQVLEGWEAIMGLGVQAPEQLLSVWKPNLQKMLSVGNAGILRETLAASANLFKTYAITSVGFVVRNSYSSAFMNAVAGVDGRTTIDGFKAMQALNKHGAAKWLDELGIIDPVVREQYNEALRAAIATGLQGSFNELREPVLAGTLGERLINLLEPYTLGTRLDIAGSRVGGFVKEQGITSNIYTRKVRKANTRVESAVRFPMALDVIRKGGTYDDAVSKVTRYHFDYTDLSQLDEAALKFIPFWIWTTRNIPNQITNQFMRPNVYNIYEKVQQSLPVDSNETIPAWQLPYEPLGLGRRNIPLLGEGYYTAQLDLPNLRLSEGLRSITSPTRLLGQAYPYVKLPFEYAAGRQLGIDVGPFDERVPARGLELAAVEIMEGLGFNSIKDANGNKTIGGFTQYAFGNAIPFISRLQRLSGGTLGGKENYTTRTGQSWLNELGIPLRIIKDDNVRSEYLNRTFTLKDFTEDMINRGLIPKED